MPKIDNSLVSKHMQEYERKKAAAKKQREMLGRIAGSMTGIPGAGEVGGSIAGEGDLSGVTAEGLAMDVGMSELGDYMDSAKEASTAMDSASQGYEQLSENLLEQGMEPAISKSEFMSNVAEGYGNPNAFTQAIGGVGNTIDNTTNAIKNKFKGALSSVSDTMSDTVEDAASGLSEMKNKVSNEAMSYKDKMMKKYFPEYASQGKKIMNYYAEGTERPLSRASVNDRVRSSELMRGFNRDVERANMAASGEFNSAEEIERTLDQIEQRLRDQMMIENNMQSHESYGAPYPGPLYQAGGSCGGIKPKYRAGGSEGAEKSFTDYQPESSLPSFFKYIPDAYQVSNWFQSKLPMKYRLNKPVEYRAMLDNQNTMSEYNIDPTSEQGAQIFDQDLYFPDEKGYGPLKSVKSKSSDGSSKEKTYYNPLEKR